MRAIRGNYETRRTTTEAHRLADCAQPDSTPILQLLATEQNAATNRNKESDRRTHIHKYGGQIGPKANKNNSWCKVRTGLRDPRRESLGGSNGSSQIRGLSRGQVSYHHNQSRLRHHRRQSGPDRQTSVTASDHWQWSVCLCGGPVWPQK